MQGMGLRAQSCDDPEYRQQQGLEGQGIGLPADSEGVQKGGGRRSSGCPMRLQAVAEAWPVAGGQQFGQPTPTASMTWVTLVCVMGIRMWAGAVCGPAVQCDGTTARPEGHLQS